MHRVECRLVGRRGFLKTLCGLSVYAAFSSTGFADSGNRWASQVIRLRAEGSWHKPPVVTALAPHPDGELLAIGGDDHFIRAWDLAEERTGQLLDEHTDWVRALAYSPDGRLLASAGNDRRLILWETATGRKIHEQVHSGHAITSIRFTPDASQLATVGFGQPLRMYDVADGKLLRELSCPCVDIRMMTLAPDGELIACGGRNGVVRIWDTNTGEVSTEYAAHDQCIRGLAFSPDGQLLASCSEDRRVRVYDPRIGADFVLPRQPTKILSLVFLGPDQLATGGSDNHIRIWDLEEREEIDRLEGHTGSVVALAYSGRLLVSAGYDTTVRVWQRRSNVARGRPGSRSRVNKVRRN